MSHFTEPAAPARRHRLLGYMEARMHLMHELLRGSTQGVVALRVRGPLDPEKFVAAVRVVVASHDLLRCVIVQRPEGLAFEVQEEVRVAVRVVTRESDDQWSMMMRSEVEVPVDATRSLFRITLIAGAPGEAAESDIVLVVHHALMDAGAVDVFFTQVLGLTVGSRQASGTSLPVPPPAEAAVPKRMRMPWDEFGRLQRALADERQVERLPHVTAAPLDERRTETALLALDASTVGELESRCKKRGFTFNSLASAALVNAVRRASPERSHVQLNTTFSLRRLCAGLAAEDLGCYMTIVPTVHAVSGEREVETIAREHHAALAVAILRNARCPVDVPTERLHALTAALCDVREFVQDIGLTYGESTLAERHGPLAIVHMYATVNRSVGTLAAVVHGVKIGGKAYFTINHTSPLQSASWADEVVRHFAAAFHEAAAHAA